MSSATPLIRQAQRGRLASLLGGMALAALPVWAQEQEQKTDLTQVSIETLMNVEVTSASKKSQKLSRVAAAIFVITKEDIRRSGATNIPDLLRMVPGVNVAQINANTWAISARGFNFEFENKLLVLVDGRAVYTPLFGGVFWDTQDVPPEDIDRIEVIRGPGGTIWGANAVNGVINIITTRASDTPGALVIAGGGTQQQEFGTAQYGGKVTERENFRVFGKYSNYGGFPDLNGIAAKDNWHLLHGGFRVDSDLSTKDTLTTEGDLYSGNEGATIVHSVLSPIPSNANEETIAGLSGGSLMGRWSHKYSDRSDSSLQIFFDRYTRAGPESHEERNTVDVDFQSHLAWGSRQDFIWGAGYRHTADQTVGTIDQAFFPANQDAHQFDFFAQDEIALKPGQLTLSAGIKAADSYFTGFDLEPSGRLVWTPNSRHTIWTAISRANQTPTRRREGIDAALAALPGPAEVVLLGNPNAKSEHVIAYELGYRTQFNNRTSLDVATFFNTYQDLESIEAQPSFLDTRGVPAVLIHPLVLGNKMHGTTEGAEVSVNWKATHRWTVSPGYSFLEMHLHTAADSTDTVSVANTQGSNPNQRAQVQSHVGLPLGLSWDLNAYFVGRLPAKMVASYTRVDTQVRWRFGEHLEVSVVGQNLLRDTHVEFSDFLQVVNSSQIKRNVYSKLVWRF